MKTITVKSDGRMFSANKCCVMCDYININNKDRYKRGVCTKYGEELFGFDNAYINADYPTERCQECIEDAN